MASGPLASPGDLFSWENDATGFLRLFNSSDVDVLIYDGTTAIPTFSVRGALGASIGLYNATNAGNLDCTGVPGALQAINTDADPKQLQVCIAGTLYHIDLVP
jgi:hypothetical protein